MPTQAQRGRYRLRPPPTRHATHRRAAGAGTSRITPHSPVWRLEFMKFGREAKKTANASAEATVGSSACCHMLTVVPLHTTFNLTGVRRLLRRCAMGRACHAMCRRQEPRTGEVHVGSSMRCTTTIVNNGFTSFGLCKVRFGVFLFGCADRRASPVARVRLCESPVECRAVYRNVYVCVLRAFTAESTYGLLN